MDCVVSAEILCGVVCYMAMMICKAHGQKLFLVKERESHVGILFFLDLLLLSRGSSSTSSGGSSTTSRSDDGTTSRDRGELLATSSDHFLNILAFKLGQELADGISIRLNANCKLFEY